MSNWGFVTVAFTVVWGSLALYGLSLARRVTQAREVADSLRNAAEEGVACDDQRAR